MITKDGKIELSGRLFALLTIALLGLLIFWGFRVMEMWRTSHGLYGQQVTVDAQGKAYATPDVAEITIGVHTDGDKSDAVVKSNTEKMNKVIEEIKKLGIEEKDIQTTSYYMNPNYIYTPSGESVQKGYTIDQTILVKVRDLTKAGDVVANATASGANTLGGIQFKVDDPEKAKEQAREEAIKKIKEKADMIAKQTGLHFGGAVNYYEYMDTSAYGYGMGGPAYMDVSGAGVGGGGATPTTEAGQQEIVLTVSMTYLVD
ncbi:MAG: SIMPL domain-containing protein [Candidatus Gracilibacteria bacterium]|jgi:hypothetical protein